MACVFEKDTVYYRADIIYSCGVDTSAYLGTQGGAGDDAIDIEKIAREINLFVKDEDAKSLAIVKHEARAGDGLAHVAGVLLRLERDASGAIVSKKD